jgi:hypothetical protein
MKFVTPENEPVPLGYDGHIYAIDNSGIKIARFTGVHPLNEAIDQISRSLDEFDETDRDTSNHEHTCQEFPTTSDAWTIIIPCPENMQGILQSAIANAFSTTELVDRIIGSLPDFVK